MKPIKLLFVYIPTIPYEEFVKSFSNKHVSQQPQEMPLGILYLSSYCKKVKPEITVGLIDYVRYAKESSRFANVASFITELANGVEFAPDVLAFSLNFSTSHKFFNEAVCLLKEKWPEAVIAVGGNHATNAVNFILSNSLVDYVFRGEGEIAFAEFIRRLSSCESLEGIKGMYNKTTLGGSSPMLCDQPDNLDDLPFPDWDILDMEFYLSSSSGRKLIGGSATRNAANFMASRGCPFSCIFCASHTVHGKKMRYRSADNVVKEVRTLYEKYGVDIFMPMDDLFISNKKISMKLLEALRNIGIPDIQFQFPNGLNVSLLDEEIIDLLVEMGMKVAFLAVESGSESVQKYIVKKRCELAKTERLVKHMQGKGVMVRCFFIIGFPGETVEQMMETIQFAKKLQPDWCVFHVAAPLKGSKMYDMSVDLGYFEDGPDIWNSRSFYERLYDTPEVTADHLNLLCDRATMEVNYRYNRHFMTGEYDKAVDLFTDIIEKHPFHVIALFYRAICFDNMNEHDKAQSDRRRITELAENDSRAQEMSARYKDLMEDGLKAS